MNDESKYAKEMFGILNKLSIRRRKEFIARTLKDLKKLGKSNKWIYFGLRGKEIPNWEKWGFGLLFNEKYQEYIEMELETDSISDEETLNMFNELTGSEIEEEYVEYV